MSRRAPGSRLSSGGGGGTKYPRSWNDWQPRAVPVAYGNSQARVLIGSEPRLQPTPQLMATLDP